MSRGRTRRGQWPGIKPGQSGGEEGVKREHTGEGGGRSWGGWEVGSRRALDDKFSAIGSFDADSPTKSKTRILVILGGGEDEEGKEERRKK